VMPLLEVVQSILSSTGALEAGFEWGKSLKKTVVHAQDKAGFIVNRLLIPYLLDGIRAWEEGFGSIEQIDAAMKGGANHPMGPFELLDFVGLDTTHSVGEIMFDEYRERRFAPPPTLRKLVAAGHLGRKSGRGFYDYSHDQPVPMDRMHEGD
jgi:3-hydroxybutyryl-CoA dehydrogenase